MERRNDDRDRSRYGRASTVAFGTLIPLLLSGCGEPQPVADADGSDSCRCEPSEWTVSLDRLAAMAHARRAIRLEVLKLAVLADHRSGDSATDSTGIAPGDTHASRVEAIVAAGHKIAASLEALSTRHAVHAADTAVLRELLDAIRPIGGDPDEASAAGTPESDLREVRDSLRDQYLAADAIIDECILRAIVDSSR